MSLAQHVTQAEGFDYERPFLPDQSLPADTAERGIGSDKSKWRPLSYGVTEQTDQVPQEGPIAAYEVSRARRLGKRQHPFPNLELAQRPCNIDLPSQNK